MKTFVNSKSKVQISVLDYKVHEGRNAWYISGDNISLPKSEWKLKKNTK